MRSQIVITIDTEVNRRNKGETVQEFAVRMDEALTRRINEWQQKPAYENWDLLSVSPAGFNAVGFFTTLWEYDPELHEDVKTEGDTESENKVANPSFFSGIMDEVFGPQRQYIGDVQVHDIAFGDIVCINGVNFKLTHFGQDYEEAMATLTPLKEVTQQEEEPVRRPSVSRGGMSWHPRG